MESDSDGVAAGRSLLHTIRNQAQGAASGAMAKGATVASVDGDLVTVIDPSATESSERLIARVKGPPVEVGDPGVLVPLDGGSMIFIPTGGEAGGGDPHVPNVSGILRIAANNSAGMATSSSSTWVTQISTPLTLPAGTWEIAMFYSAICSGHSGATFFGNLRISSPFVTGGIPVAAAGTGRVTPHEAGTGVIVSNGVTPTLFTGQIQWVSGDTMRAENGTIFAVCWKQGTPSSGGGGGGGGGGGVVEAIADTSTVNLTLTGTTLKADVIATGISHTDLANIGTNTHTQIDTHLASTANPHSVTKAQVGLGNVDNTADTAKPVSTAQQTALDLKANLASPTFTGTVAGITKAMVGLGNVDNTADTAKPVSTAQAAAIAVVQNDVNAHEALTNNPHAVTKTQVGLGSVDNTSDAAKPVSTAQQTALNLKANDADVVHDTGSETIAGVKTFSSDPIIPDEAYGFAWNGSLEPPTKNALYDKIEALVLGGGGGPSFLIGEVKIWTLNTAPSGWLFCRGQTVLRSSAYGTLLVADGLKYGVGDGSTTVNVPNLQGRIPLGRDPGDLRFDNLGEFGGEYEHLITWQEAGLYPHAHTISGGQTNVNREAGTAATAGQGGTATGTAAARNADLAHNNLQPYLVIEYIVYTGE